VGFFDRVPGYFTLRCGEVQLDARDRRGKVGEVEVDLGVVLRG